MNRQDVDKWIPCKVAISSGKVAQKAYVYLSDVSGALDLGMRVVIELMHPNGTTLQVIGVVERRIESMKNYRYFAIRIPWDIGVALAKLVGVDAKKGERVEIYNYVTKVREVSTPPLR